MSSKPKSKPRPLAPVEARKRQRLPPQAREEQILAGAIAYFAEAGLDGQTRELARRLGITQPLLFRYFPSKQHLIERIYEEVYLKRWKTEWERIIADTSLPTAERFRRFEFDYQRTIHDYAWLRIFVSAGLKGYDLPRRYLGTVRERIFTPLLIAMRAEHRLPKPSVQPLAEEEFELLFGIHGALVYIGIRELVYGLDGPTDADAVRAALLDSALPGLGQTYRQTVSLRAGRPKGKSKT